MTDSACVRAGYDDTGRYRIRELDQCPECRGHGQHSPDCPTVVVANQGCGPTLNKAESCSTLAPTISLNIIEGEAESCWCGAGLDEPHSPDCHEEVPMDEPINIPWALQQELFDLHAKQALAALPGYLHLHADTIMAMAAARMEDGYHQYGSAMFAYDPATRLRNVLEELADCVCYLVSGPVE